MTDRDFWLIVRRALLMIVKAIEKKYYQKEMPLADNKTASVSWLPDD
jgi:hypothetical protein